MVASQLLFVQIGYRASHRVPPRAKWISPRPHNLTGTKKHRRHGRRSVSFRRRNIDPKSACSRTAPVR